MRVGDNFFVVFVKVPLNQTYVRNFIKIDPLELFLKFLPPNGGGLGPLGGVGEKIFLRICKRTTQPDICAKFHQNRSFRTIFENLTPRGGDRDPLGGWGAKYSCVFVKEPPNLINVQNFIKIGQLDQLLIFFTIYPPLTPLPPQGGRAKISWLLNGDYYT